MHSASKLSGITLCNSTFKPTPDTVLWNPAFFTVGESYGPPGVARLRAFEYAASRREVGDLRHN